jgi:hypothetical protein
MLSRLLTTFTKLILQIFCSPIFCNTDDSCFECHFKMLTSLFLLLSFWHTAHLCPFSGYHHHFCRRHYHHYPMSILYLFYHIFIPFSFSFSCHCYHSSMFFQTQLFMQGPKRTFRSPAGKIRLVNVTVIYGGHRQVYWLLVTCNPIAVTEWVVALH